MGVCASVVVEDRRLFQTMQSTSGLHDNGIFHWLEEASDSGEATGPWSKCGLVWNQTKRGVPTGPSLRHLLQQNQSVGQSLCIQRLMSKRGIRQVVTLRDTLDTFIASNTAVRVRAGSVGAGRESVPLIFVLLRAPGRKIA